MATFTQRNGRWRAEVRREGQRSTKSFTTKKDAEAWARSIETAIERGQRLAPKGTGGTFAELLSRYEADVWPVKKWGTSKAYELKQLKKDLGEKAVSAITKQVVMDHAGELSERMGGPGIATRISYLVEVFRAARDLWGAHVPLEAVEEAVRALKRQKLVGRSQPRTRRPLDEEIELVIQHATKSQRMEIDLVAIVNVLRVLPLRVGELVGIEWDDLRPDTKSVVLRNRKHPDVRVREGNDYLVPLLTVNGIDTWTLIAERPRYYDKPFPWTRGAVSSSWWIAARQAGVNDLHLHDLRAGAISRLLEANVALPVVAHLSGHKNWKILARHYSRLDPAAMHGSVARALAAASEQ